MRNDSALNALFPSTRRGILAAVLVQPDRAWYGSELARRMGVPPSSLQRELRNLTHAGLLRTHRHGRMTYFQANKHSPLFPDLRGLMLKTDGLVDTLADALKPLASTIKTAFVYGSVARGEELSDSDIDLLVIGAVSPVELVMPLRHGTELLGRPINPTVYTATEFEKKRNANDHFLSSVLDGPKLLILGSDNDLGKATERQPRDPPAAKQSRAGQPPVNRGSQLERRGRPGAVR